MGQPNTVLQIKLTCQPAIVGASPNPVAIHIWTQRSQKEVLTTQITQSLDVLMSKRDKKWTFDSKGSLDFCTHRLHTKAQSI